MFDTLFISASFFGYAGEIKAELERGGRRVLWFEDRPALDTTSKAKLRLAPSLMRGAVSAFCKAVGDEARRHDIREVFFIKGEAFGPREIRALRQALPAARFVLYYWDSYRNMPAGSFEKVGLFDRAFTFDPNDARADSRLTYRPLFFLPEYADLPRLGQDIDVLFVGTAHTDRYAVLRRLARRLPPELRFERVLFMPSRLLYGARRVFSPAFWSASREEFSFRPLKKFEVLSLISRARIVVDIERTVQAGYTMRTIEMLGAARKLITTNSLIESADFYHADNQLFVDRTHPVVPERFLGADWNPAKDHLLPKYSLRGWVADLLGADRRG